MNSLNELFTSTARKASSNTSERLEKNKKLTITVSFETWKAGGVKAGIVLLLSWREMWISAPMATSALLGCSWVTVNVRNAERNAANKPDYTEVSVGASR